MRRPIDRGNPRKVLYNTVNSVLISTRDQEKTIIEDFIESPEKQMEAEKYRKLRLKKLRSRGMFGEKIRNTQNEE